MSLELVRLTDRPQLKEQAAQWFHQKWGVPLAAYQESMEQCLSARSPVPQWYLAMEGERIVGGMGVIENDFHDRKDLSPNVCAVYTEPDCRGQGRRAKAARPRLRGHEGEGDRHPLPSDRPHLPL